MFLWTPCLHTVTGRGTTSTNHDTPLKQDCIPFQNISKQAIETSAFFPSPLGQNIFW